MSIFIKTMANLKKCVAFLSMVCLSLIGSPLLAAGCDNPAIPESTPDSRFNIVFRSSMPRIVRDTQTGLDWTYCSIGQTGESDLSCSGSAVEDNWGDALSTADNYVVMVDDPLQTTYDDWRLPNIKELASIVELCNADPAINQDIFPDTPIKRFWSSSLRAPGEPTDPGYDKAWSIDFLRGTDHADAKNAIYPVRLVRGGL